MQGQGHEPDYQVYSFVAMQSRFSSALNRSNWDRLLTHQDTAGYVTSGAGEDRNRVFQGAFLKRSVSEASPAPLAPEPPQPSRAERAISWVKRNPIYIIGAALVPIFGALAGAPKAWDAISTVLNVPTCLTYSDVYYYYNGHFKRVGQKWIEFQPTVKYNFDEIFHDRDYIVLLDKTPRDIPRWQSLLVRLPVCGRTVQFTFENPERWTDLVHVERKIAPKAVSEQAKFEQ
jgi:hypothetical protein